MECLKPINILKTKKIDYLINWSSRPIDQIFQFSNVIVSFKIYTNETWILIYIYLTKLQIVIYIFLWTWCNLKKKKDYQEKDKKQHNSVLYLFSNLLFNITSDIASLIVSKIAWGSWTYIRWTHLQYKCVAEEGTKNREGPRRLMMDWKRTFTDKVWDGKRVMR